MVEGRIIGVNQVGKGDEEWGMYASKWGLSKAVNSGIQ